MKVALVYDRVNKWGGAERVLLALHELFPDAPLYTSVYNQEKARWADTFHVRTSYLQSFPYASASHEYYALFMPTAFEQFSFDGYDLVISVTSEAAKGIITKPQTKHISYVLTPTRYLWSGYDEYFASPFLRTLSRPAISYLRYWDTIAAQRPDVMVAISEEVRTRINTYYQREADVIYPPLVPPEKSTKQIPLVTPEPYFLIVSRLVPYKRVDLAVKACTELNLPLIVIGTGSESRKLESMAGPSVRFLGSLSDEVLAAYYEKCRGLIFPGTEDFGLTTLEAQYYGKPVIAYKKGGALETVIEKKTGIFFPSQTVKALKQALLSFETQRFQADAAKAQAARFNNERFRREFLSLVERIVENGSAR